MNRFWNKILRVLLFCITIPTDLRHMIYFLHTVQGFSRMLDSCRFELQFRGPMWWLKLQYNVHGVSTHMKSPIPHIISRVQANIILPISKAWWESIFDSNLWTRTWAFSLKIGTKVLRILLLNVGLINLRSFFHIWTISFNEGKRW